MAASRSGPIVSPRRFSSGQHQRNTAAWGATPLQPLANARLLLAENAIPGDTTSAVVASHVLECFLERANYISAKENGPGVETGDFTYNGYLTRAAPWWLPARDSSGWGIWPCSTPPAMPPWTPTRSTPPLWCWSSAPTTAPAASVRWCSR